MNLKSRDLLIAGAAIEGVGWTGAALWFTGILPHLAAVILGGMFVTVGMVMFLVGVVHAKKS